MSSKGDTWKNSQKSSRFKQEFFLEFSEELQEDFQDKLLLEFRQKSIESFKQGNLNILKREITINILEKDQKKKENKQKISERKKSGIESLE